MTNTFREYRRLIQEKAAQLDEELLPKEKIDADRMRGNGYDYYRSAFLKQHPVAEAAFRDNRDKRKFTTRVPISIEEPAAGAPHSNVDEFLRKNGYSFSHADYRAGIAKKKTQVGDPSRGIPMQEKETVHKIGGLLEKHNAPEDIVKKYTNDSYRTGAKTTEWDAVVDGSHEGTYAASTGQGWTSCANMRKGDNGYGGPASRKMEGEINNHTHNVYLVPKGGDVDKDAVARISYKLHTGLTTGHQTLIPENRVYGSAPNGFAKASHEVMVKMFTQPKEDEVYQKHQDVYNDSDKAFLFPKNPSSDAIDAAYKAAPKLTKTDKTKESLINQVNPDHKYKSRDLNAHAANIRAIHMAANSGDYMGAAKAIIHADNQLDDSAQYRMIENPHVDAAIEKVAKHFDPSNEEHVGTLMGRRYNTLVGHFRHRVLKEIPPARTPEEYSNFTNLVRAGLQLPTAGGKIPISENHTMGKNPLDTIVNHLSDTNKLDGDSYTQAYHATYGKNKRSGNLYDNVVHHENEGVPGMSKVVDSVASDLHNRHYRNDDDLAVSYHLMKPSTRDRIASGAAGVHDQVRTPKEIMKAGKDGIDNHKKTMEMIATRRDKKQLENGAPE